MFANSTDQADFVNSYDTGVEKLSIFKQIHAEGDEEDVAGVKLNASECGEVSGEELGSSESTNGSSDEYNTEFDVQHFYLSD